MTAREFFTLWFRHIAKTVRRKHLEYRLKYIDMSLDVLSDNLIGAFETQSDLHKERAHLASELRRL